MNIVTAGTVTVTYAHTEADNVSNGTIAVDASGAHWMCVEIAHRSASSNFKRWVRLDGTNSCGYISCVIKPKGYKFTVEVG